MTPAVDLGSPWGAFGVFLRGVFECIVDPCLDPKASLVEFAPLTTPNLCVGVSDSSDFLPQNRPLLTSSLLCDNFDCYRDDIPV